MKKGKPDPGYADLRKITNQESKATGLPRSTCIMHEAGTGRITLWKVCKTGGYDAVNLPDMQAYIRKLENFWEK